jgi:hypothetical protein
VKIVQDIQGAVEEWIHLVRVVLQDLQGIETFTRATPLEKLPLAEALFWEARFNKLKGIHEQVTSTLSISSEFHTVSWIKGVE